MSYGSGCVAPVQESGGDSAARENTPRCPLMSTEANAFWQLAGSGARLSRNVGQADHILGESDRWRRGGVVAQGRKRMACRCPARRGAGRVDTDRSGRVGSGFQPGRSRPLQFPQRARAFSPRIAASMSSSKRVALGADRLQRARDDPLWPAPPCRRVVVFVRLPVRLVFVPITHDLVHAAAVDHARSGHAHRR